MFKLSDEGCRGKIMFAKRERRKKLIKNETTNTFISPNTETDTCISLWTALDSKF